MGYQARWGPKGFIISAGKIVGIEDLQTSYSLKTDTNEDTSGTPPTNTKGMELQPVTLSTKYLRATGTNPRGQMAEWRSLVGKAYPLYLGGKRFGPPKLQLQKVDVSDILLANSGDILACTVALSFMEYSPTTTTNASSSAKKASSTSGYTTEELKKLALSSTATTEDKSTKKTTSYTGGTRGAR